MLQCNHLVPRAFSLAGGGKRPWERGWQCNAAVPLLTYTLGQGTHLTGPDGESVSDLGNQDRPNSMKLGGDIDLDEL